MRTRVCFRVAISLVLLSLFLAPSSYGREELTLEKCLSVAMRNNKAILKAREVVAQRKAELISDRSARLPHLDVYGEYARVYSRGDSVDTEDYSASLVASQEILRFGDTPQPTFLARWALRKAGFDYEKTRIDVFYEVRKAFFSLLLTRDEIQERLELLEEFQRKHERMKERFSAGKVRPIDVREAKLEVLDEQLRINNLHRKEREQKSELLGVIGILGDVFPVQVEIIGGIPSLEGEVTISEDSLRVLVKEAFEKRIEVAELESDIEEQRKEVRETYWRWFPSFAGQAYYRRGETDLRANMYELKRSSWGIGASAEHPIWGEKLSDLKDGDWGANISMSFPIFVGLEDWGVLKMEKAKLRQLDYELENLKNRIELEVSTAYYNVIDGREKAEIERERAEVRKERLEIIEELIELPVQTYLTFDDILRQREAFTQAQKRYFDERFNYFMALEELRKAIGRMEIGM